MPTISTPPTSPLCTTTTSEANQACSVIKPYSKTLCLALVSETWQDYRFGRPTCSTPPRLPTSLTLSTSQAVDCHVIRSTTVQRSPPQCYLQAGACRTCSREQGSFCRFMDLPAEIRDIMYEMAILSRVTIGARQIPINDWRKRALAINRNNLSSSAGIEGDHVLLRSNIRRYDRWLLTICHMDYWYRGRACVSIVMVRDGNLYGSGGIK